MRGSPLIRTALVLLAIIASGLVFSNLTAEQKTKPQNITETHAPKTKNFTRARYILTLSERAAFVELKCEGVEAVVESWNLSSESGIEPLIGDIVVNLENPIVYLKVNWYELGERRGFAKLTIEADGKKTVTQVFDATGNIDEFVELKF